MSIESMKNMVVLRNLPSNIVEEAIVILKPNIKLKNLDLAENKATNKKSENKTKQDSKKYIVNEAEMIVSNYLSSIEKEKKYNYKVNKKTQFISMMFTNKKRTISSQFIIYHLHLNYLLFFLEISLYFKTATL